MGNDNNAQQIQTVTIGDNEYTLLYNFAALADAEKRTGRKIMDLCNDAMAGSLSVTELAKMFMAGLEAGRKNSGRLGKPIREDRAFQLMGKAGFAATATWVYDGIAEVLGYDPDEDADDSENPEVGSPGTGKIS